MVDSPVCGLHCLRPFAKEKVVELFRKFQPEDVLAGIQVGLFCFLMFLGCERCIRQWRCRTGASLQPCFAFRTSFFLVFLFFSFFLRLFAVFFLFLCSGQSSTPMAMTMRSECLFFLVFRFVNTAGLRRAQVSWQGEISSATGGTRPCRRWGFLRSHACTCWVDCGAGELNLLKKQGSQMA